MAKDLRNSVGRGNLDEVKRHIKKGATIYERYESGKTPLHIASHFHHLEVVKYLIEIGADVNAKDSGGTTPLMEASRTGATDVVQELIAEGADIKSIDEDEYNALFWAAWEGQADTVEFLLAQGRNANYQTSFKITPLMIASRNASGCGPEIVSLLVKAGADKDIICQNGATAQSIAEEYEEKEILAILSNAP